MNDDLPSKYQRLERPVFHSAIPSHLIDKLSPSEKYLVETISLAEQIQKFLVDAALENRRALIEIDERLQKIEEFKKGLLSKWSILVGFFLLIVPAILTGVIRHYFP